jgi:hypothetical protein
MIVPALGPQSREKTVHLSPRHELIRSGYGDSMYPL